MNAIDLRSIDRCFQGDIPGIIATASATGEPHVVHLSQVFRVDDEHVAVSDQFFRTTKANLAANPVATLLCPDPRTGLTYKLLAHFERTESEGPSFETVRRVVDAIAAMTGMADVFAVRAVLVFRVLDVSGPADGSP